MSLQSKFLSELQEISRSKKTKEGLLISNEISRVKTLLKELAKNGNKHTIVCQYPQQVINQLIAEGLSAQLVGMPDRNDECYVEITWSY